MNSIILVAVNLLIAFAGYAIGRVSHILGGHIKAPHHWIYGAVLAIAGGIFYSRIWGFPAMSFGMGLFISDLKDFLKMKIYGVDEPGPKRFWDID
jgi:hypothetical protein